MHTFVEERNGIPVLKAVFDFTQLKPDEINVSIEGRTFTATARHTEEKPLSRDTKTMIRKFEIPTQVIPELITTEVEDGFLKIEMPLGLPIQNKKPPGSHIYPITQDSNGKRKIQVPLTIGTGFTNDDVSVKCIGRHLYINASHPDETGKDGQEVRPKDFEQEYILPEHHCVDYTSFTLDAGELIVDIFLMDEKPFKSKVVVEDLPCSPKAAGSKFLF